MSCLRIAHRGVSARFPENSLAAFEAAIQEGCDGIELDVHLSGDGIPVVVHDPVGYAPASSIEGPTLEQVLALDRGEMVLMVELKTGDHDNEELVDASLELLRRENRGPLVIGSLSPEIVTHLLDEEEVMGIVEDEGALEQYLDWEIPLLAIDHEMIDANLMFRLKEKSVWSWTVDEKEEAKRLIALGVTGLISNDPMKLC